MQATHIPSGEIQAREIQTREIQAREIQAREWLEIQQRQLTWLIQETGLRPEAVNLNTSYRKKEAIDCLSGWLSGKAVIAPRGTDNQDLRRLLHISLGLKDAQLIRLPHKPGELLEDVLVCMGERQLVVRALYPANRDRMAHIKVPTLKGDREIISHHEELCWYPNSRCQQTSLNMLQARLSVMQYMLGDA